MTSQNGNSEGLVREKPRLLNRCDSPRRAMLPSPEPGEAVALGEGFWWTRAPLPGQKDHVNVFLLRDADGWTLVDAGCCTDECRAALDSTFSGLGIEKPDIKRVVVTHHHPDHYGVAAEFQQHGAEVLASRECLATAERRYSNRSLRPSEGEVRVAQRAGLVGVHLEAYRRRAPLRFPNPAPVDGRRSRVIEHGQLLQLNGRPWRVIMGHGHAAGHVTLWSEDGFAMTGDHFLMGMTTNLAARASQPESDPVQAFKESSEAMLRLASEDTVILPGHNDPFVGVRARWRQMLSSRASYLSRLLAAVAEPRTALECLPAVYQRELQDYEKHSLLAECVAHLSHLHRRGLVEQLPHRSGATLWRRTPGGAARVDPPHDTPAGNKLPEENRG